eukprot:scaffold13190_cov60-Phaeocystis_antarctica.AAC.5
MPYMVVTLEVSRLSGWLNAEALCRVKGGHAMRGEVRGTGGGRAVRWRRREQRAGGGPDRRSRGAGQAAERT